MSYAWLDEPASAVTTTARSLLGWQVSANGVSLRLTEVEAYLGGGQDPASHANGRRTPRNTVMFGQSGVAYIYFIYGAHHCLNIVCGHIGEAAAVLLRAGQIVEGVELARARRPTARGDRDLARGPGCLVRALALDGQANGTSMVDGSGPIQLTPPAQPIDRELVQCGPRVGVAVAQDFPWRFWIAGEPSVSAFRQKARRSGVS